jgi:nitronate monooxygenase
MRPPTGLIDLLGITHPIIQAPMAGFSMAPLAAAVSNAGGLGSLGSATSGAEQVRAQIEAIRAATNRPFAVNFFVHAPPKDDPARTARMGARLAPYYRELGLGLPEAAGSPPPPFDDAMLEAVLAARPSVVSFHFGLPQPQHLREVKATGARILSSATTVEEARWLESRGVDAVIAQGLEAGGHRATFLGPFADGEIGTLALVPQVVDAVRCPVIAAGGIMDGRGIAAALMLGAAGVQMGTAFLGCPEATVHPVHRRELHGTRARETRLTRLFSGRPARAIVNRYLREAGDAETEVLDFPLQRGLSGPLAQASAERDSPDFVAMWAGQGAALIRDLPAAELVAALVAETERALA